MSFDPMELTTVDKLVGDRISAAFYGIPKIGKTTLCKTLIPLVDNPTQILYVSADPGGLAIKNTGVSAYSIANEYDEKGKLLVSASDKITLLGKNIYKLIEKYSLKWLFIDGLDAIGDVMVADALSKTKDGRQAYGQAGDRANSFILFFREITGVSVVFVTHMERIKGDADIYRPSFPGNAVPDRLMEKFDIVGCMRAVTDDGENFKRMIQISPLAQPMYQCGDRSGALADFEEPNLAAIYHKIQEYNKGV